MRPAHYWRRGKSTSLPSNIIVVDTETHHGEAARVPGGERQTLRLGVAVAYRLEKGKRTRVKWLDFTTADEFWSFVSSRLDKRRPLWVFAHNAHFDFGVLDGWRWVWHEMSRPDFAAVTGSIFLLKGQLAGGKVCLSDTTNYWKSSLKVVGQSVGLAKMEMPAYDAQTEAWQAYCKNDVEITALAIDKLLGFVSEHKLGPWGATISSLAFNSYRKSFMSYKVLVHDNAEALKLERGAYYGGLVECPVIGENISGPIHELDVCSMYPSFYSADLPYQLVGFTTDPARMHLQVIFKSCAVFGDVTIESPDRPFPLRVGQAVFHVTGTFRTQLADPELRQAGRLGLIKQWHSVSWYRRAPILGNYANWFFRIKKLCEDKSDKAGRTLAKYWLNTLYGKTGQRSPVWKEWGEEALAALCESRGLAPTALMEWANFPPVLELPEESVSFLDRGVSAKTRNYWGITEVAVDQHESRDSCPQIAACITSMGRCLLRELQSVAGKGNWFYCDTDSIWCNDAGREALEKAGYVQTDTLGKLTVNSTCESLTVYGPKDYVADARIRMKGVRNPHKVEADGGFKQMHFPTAVAQIKRGDFGAVFVAEIVKHLRRRYLKGVQLDNGITRPFNLPGDTDAMLASAGILNTKRGEENGSVRDSAE